ncbi:MAG: hypothetical protein BZY80_03645 [SAR202 cluster bacterium Io17-Chloro-G2]|nr:MAG: hypothetical protein BZY80_03645 [SAR202 cluster bacterium Io17-Chloro-G2]
MLSSVDPTRLKLTNDEGTRGVLVGTRCQDCQVCVFGPAVFCQACTSSSLEPVELSQRGSLYSYTIVRVPPSGWPGPVPYFLGQVELPEGPQVLAEIIGCREADLKIGMEVELALQPVILASGNGAETTKAVYKWKPVMSTDAIQEASP